MKIKNMFSWGIVVTMLLISFTVPVAFATEIVSENALLTEEAVNTCSEKIGDVNEIFDIAQYSTTSTKKYSVNWTVKAGATLSGSTNMYMYPGDEVTFNLSYTPSTDTSVKIGLLTSQNTFRYYTVTSGSLSSTMSITYEGVHKLRVQNNSDVDIVLTGTYTTTITVPNTTTWFSQFNSGVGATWNSSNLSNLYLPNMDICSDYCDSVGKCANTPMYTTSAYSATSNQLEAGHINKFGCSVSSLAMIFRNMDATTTENKYDFRNSTSTNQAADPFTVTMANIDWPTITFNDSNSRYEITSYTSSYSPTYVYWAKIANTFGVTATKVSLANKTTAQKADILAQYINDNPEGILVRVANSHSLIFTGTTHIISSSVRSYLLEEIPVTLENEVEIVNQEYIDELNSAALTSVTSTVYDGQFTCYDPGTTDSSKGNGVTFDNSWTASYYGGIDKVTYIYYFD